MSRKRVPPCVLPSARKAKLVCMYMVTATYCVFRLVLIFVERFAYSGMGPVPYPYLGETLAESATTRHMDVN